MTSWTLGGEEFSTTEIDRGIRQRPSHISNLIVEQIKREKAEGADNSIGLSIIDCLKKQNKYRLLKSESFLGIDRGFCEEAYNDALLRVYEKIDTFDQSKSSLNTWIDNVIYWRHQARYADFLRTMNPKNSLSLNDEREVEELSQKASLDDAYERIAENDAFHQILKKMTQQQRQVLLLAKKGLTPTEMVKEGHIQGASVNAVAVRLSSALSRFRQLIAEAGWKSE